MTTIGSIGIGLFILLIVWIVAIIIFVIGIKLQSNIAWIALGSASLLTVILLCIPTEKHQKHSDIEFVEKDYIIIYKNCILAFMLLSALVGLFIFFISYCIEPIRPRPFKSFYEN